jgi:transposase InsO family protein
MRTSGEVRDLVVMTRLRLRCNALILAAVTGVPARTCSRIVSRAGCPALSEYDPVGGGMRPHGPATRTRYERERPGDLVHIDVKKVARIPEGGGWRAHGRDGRDRRRSTGTECLHVAIDDHSRVAYAEELGDERKETCAGFVLRTHAYFASLGVHVQEYMTDNGPGYRSDAFSEALASAGASHIFTRPYSPWQNGKVERMNQTLAREWAYARPYKTNAERSEALSAFLDHYNCDRPHSACGGLPPMSRVNNVLANNN